MTISRLELKNFTVFADTKFEFCPGINVLIGENASGKTHVLKLLYASRTALLASGEPDVEFTTHTLHAFFGTRSGTADRLLRHGAALRSGTAVVHGAQHEAQRFRMFGLENLTMLLGAASLRRGDIRSSVFLPPRDVLAMYPGFTSAYENRELSFDGTYYDLCRQLSATRLRGASAKAVAPLITPLERVLGGEVRLEHDGFHLHSAHGDIAAPFLAEGWRKLATLAYLIANGSLTAKSILFIDEPEASLNPTLIIEMVEILRRLAAAGVQIFLASHDYLLVHRLSQAAEHALEPRVPLRFFALHRPDPGAPVQVETADTLAQIDHNAILREFARYYDDEQRYTLRDLAAPVAPPAKKTPKKSAKKKATKTTSKKTAKR